MMEHNCYFLIISVVDWEYVVLWIVGIVVYFVGKALWEEYKDRKDRKRDKEKSAVKHRERQSQYLAQKRKVLEPLDVQRLKYLRKSQLEEVIPRLAVMYGISAATIWQMVNQAKEETPELAYRNMDDEMFYRDLFDDPDIDADQLDGFEQDCLMEDDLEDDDYSQGYYDAVHEDKDWEEDEED